MSRYDVVVYGASGFTGAHIVQVIATSALYSGKSIAVAGRSRDKLRKTLEDVAAETGITSVIDYPIIIAHTGDDSTLAAMAKQAKVIINAVGPYRLHGEPVVRAAVENGASHVDISGEPSFLEQMEKDYADKAQDMGVYVVGACGFDSIPCDLGTDFLKRNFDGTLGYVETFVRQNTGPSGYAIYTGTYESLVLAIASFFSDNLGALRRAIMPEKLPEAKYKPPRRCIPSRIRERSLSGWALPFPGVDKDIVKRSQYYDYYVNGKKPIAISTYVSVGSFINSILVTVWLSFFSVFCLIPPTRKLLLAYPDLCTFNIFKKAGPTKQQIKETSFDYFIYGRGWGRDETVDAQRPTKIGSAVCHGPDGAYFATSACIVSAALAILDDKDKLPKQGGVYTTASAFRETRIYEYLRSHGVTYEMIEGSRPIKNI